MMQRKKSQVIFTLYQEEEKHLVNVFDVVDFIVAYYKINAQKLSKTSLYSILYLYQLISNMKFRVSILDDLFVIKNKNTQDEFLQPIEVGKKCARFEKHSDLTKLIKPIRSYVNLSSKIKHTQVATYLYTILPIVSLLEEEILINKIKESSPYLKANKKGLISFSKETLLPYKKERETSIEYILNSILGLNVC